MRGNISVSYGIGSAQQMIGNVVYVHISYDLLTNQE